MDIMNIIDVMDIMDILEILNITAWMAMAAAVWALVWNPGEPKYKEYYPLNSTQLHTVQKITGYLSFSSGSPLLLMSVAIMNS